MCIVARAWGEFRCVWQSTLYALRYPYVLVPFVACGTAFCKRVSVDGVVFYRSITGCQLFRRCYFESLTCHGTVLHLSVVESRGILILLFVVIIICWLCFVDVIVNSVIIIMIIGAVPCWFSAVPLVLSTQAPQVSFCCASPLMSTLARPASSNLAASCIYFPYHVANVILNFSLPDSTNGISNPGSLESVSVHGANPSQIGSPDSKRSVCGDEGPARG